MYLIEFTIDGRQYTYKSKYVCKDVRLNQLPFELRKFFGTDEQTLKDYRLCTKLYAVELKLSKVDGRTSVIKPINWFSWGIIHNLCFGLPLNKF